jgi:signal transduction histidine kinase
MNDAGNLTIDGMSPLSQDPLSARVRNAFATSSRQRLNALVQGVDCEIEHLRSRLLHLLTEDLSPELADHSGHAQALEELVHSLRLANENLVIASLKASDREHEVAQAHQRQSEFLSMLAHELRNPLAPIAMGVELLGNMSAQQPELQSLQSVLARQTDHLMRLVEDLMDATRITTGKIKVRKSPLLLSKLLAQALETSQPVLALHHQPASLQLPEQPVWIDGDLVRLTQLFCNLLINASKFSADGSPIAITAKRESDAVHISVKDQGMGISPERQAGVFDLFVQGPVAGEQRAAGLGVGLSLVRTIAQLHAGEVKVFSEGAGHGSEFVVTLPVLVHDLAAQDRAQALIGAAKSASLGAATHKRVLLIDDSADINFTLGELLKEAGHSVDIALTGLEGLRMGSQGRYDAICCDIGLPDISGCEVAQRLRLAHSTARLVAISGFDQPEHKALALQAGFEHYLIKPIFGQELLELISDADH